MLLFLEMPRRDTRPLATEPISRFGSLPAVRTETREALERQDGLSANAIAVLRMPEAAAQRLARVQVRSRPVLDNWDRFLECFDKTHAAGARGQARCCSTTANGCSLTSR